ncbi:SDR family NAD(P)-dependent oxidoreductase [Sphingopyxis sp. MWB1]|uniref:SDR family NAD(P)-dependent oxidoreductase n=1 Tax=Sphingopyxis sp. MWB1 TaxID=1537715 RepID=UPI00051A2C0E|nr:SDR family NAD(P)-dependent oxidoreductase [Sphingopyxis sp. MWB1]
MNITNQHIVLTGASSGIGREIATMLAPDNRLTLIGRRVPEGIEPAPHRFLGADLADAAAVRAAAAAAIADEGTAVDGLINCAAIQYTPRLTDADFDPERSIREIAVNLTAPVLLAAALLPALRRAPAAFICNVNSGLALVPKSESAVYCATKAGLDNFSQGLRLQLAGTSIAVLQAFLPLVDTPMTAGRGRGKMDAATAAKAILRGIENRHADNDIGKVGLLRLLRRLSPALASRVMQGAAQ